MTAQLSEHETDSIDTLEEEIIEEEKEEKDRRWLLLLLLLLVLCAICGVYMLFFRYTVQPEPLPEIIPLPAINYPPHYLFSIYGVDQPVAVALSSQGDRLYVAEAGGNRMIKMFDQDGNSLGAFSNPRTTSGERAPIFLAVDNRGRVFASDRSQHAILVYDAEGNYLDTILGPQLTLSEYVSKHVGGLQSGDVFAYDVYEKNVYYQKEGQEELTLPFPDPVIWSPVGVRFDRAGNLLLTDVDEANTGIRIISAEFIQAPSWEEFNPPGEVRYGEYGQNNGQLLFPNSAVTDSQGRIFVTDGNNGRVGVWNQEGEFQFNFGQGAVASALSLPRGAFVDDQDRLFVVDAIGHNIKVFNVSVAQPRFLYTFGGSGLSDGLFQFPIDIVANNQGWLYVTDRDNNRVQVWSY